MEQTPNYCATESDITVAVEVQSITIDLLVPIVRENTTLSAAKTASHPFYLPPQVEQNK